MVSCHCIHVHMLEATMRYEKPEFVEIKMDAEIGSYQNDFDPQPFADAPHARPTEASDSE